ncbi:MAG: hypothetical protein IJK66_00225 [Bacilli bacterium]|nr:hypothetical protein [Bacilli bacterium]
MNEILKLVLERNKSRKVLDKNDIRRICEIIIKQHDFIIPPKISFSKSSPYNNSTYAFTVHNEVIFYMNSLEEAQDKKYNSLLSVESLDGGKVDYYNYVILDAIFHEFAHVRQNAKVTKCDSDIETKLFRKSKQLSNIKGFYRANYDVVTIETDAYARGLIESYKIYDSMPEAFITDNDRRVYGMIVMDNFLSKYYISSEKEYVKSPSEMLLESADKCNVSKVGIDIEAYKKLITSPKDLTLYKKLLLGLPLTYSEAAYIHLLGACVSNGEKVNFIKKLQKRL